MSFTTTLRPGERLVWGAVMALRGWPRVLPRDRDLTLVFTDVKGSVTLFERHGDAEAREVTRAIERVLSSCIHAHQGEVIERIGDSIFAAFTDAEEAARCVIAMQDCLRRWKTESSPRIRPGVRIGAHLGRLLVEDRYLVGHTVNVAARVMGMCDVDEAVISGPLFEKLGADIAARFRPIGPFVPRGSASLIELHRWRAPWKEASSTSNVGSTDGILCPDLREWAWQAKTGGEEYTIAGMGPENRNVWFRIGGTLMTLGRDLECDVRLQETAVGKGIGRKHAGFAVSSRKPWVFDLGGRGGILLSYPDRGRCWKVQQRAPLVSGTILRTGSLSWQVSE